MSRFKMAALLISPDRKIAEQLKASATEALTFEIVADLQTYPAPETIETRMRQVRADVLLVDVASNLDTASALIKHASGLNPQPPVIALHTVNDSAAILKSLRCGAHEFFHAPFEAPVQEAAITRLSRICDPSGANERERGRVVAFSGAKSGSGVSTLALQTAFSIHRAAPGRRILLADFNVEGGDLAFLLGLDYDRSILDLVRPGVRVNHELWLESVVEKQGIDVLPAPVFPDPEAIDPSRLQAVVDWARDSYDWIVIDLPVVFQRVSLVCISDAEHTFLVSTPELASLHLTKRAVKLLQQLEFDATRFQVLINRMDGRSELNSSDLSKIFDCRIDRGLPGDRSGVLKSLREGSALDAASPLGKAVGALADKLAGAPAERRRITQTGGRVPALASAS